MADLFDINTYADGLSKLGGVWKSTYKTTLEFEDDVHVIPPFDIVIAAVVASVGLIVYMVIALVIVIVFPILVPLITQVMGGLLEIRKDSPREQLELSAAALSEFLGTEISPEDLASGKGVQNTMDVSQRIGNALYDQLTKQFVPKGVVTPETGEQAAKTFSGFGINFATQNAIISTLADAASFHLLEDFRELGEETAKNLGLGRLQRKALGTLLTQTMQKPYMLALGSRYRPDRAGVADVVKAFNAGRITLDDATRRLAEAGYPDADIAILQPNVGAHTAPSDVERLQRWGGLTQDAAQEKIRQAGIDSLTALEMLTAAQKGRADGEVGTYASAIGDLYATGKLDEDTYDKLTADLPLTDDEKLYKKRAYGLKLEYRQKLLTWPEIVRAFENGIIDVDYVENWLQLQGYGSDEVTVKLYLLALDTKAASDKAAAAEAKAAAAKAKAAGKTKP